MQTDLFKTGRARKTDVDTSRRAAAFINPRISKLQELVLEYVATHRGCTDREMVEALRAQHGGAESTWRTRRSELTDVGKIEALGQVVLDGRPHKTWAVVANAVR